MAENAFIAVTRQGIGGIESRVWVNVDAIAFVETQAGQDKRGGATLHLRGVEDVKTMHVKDALADVVKQLPSAASADAGRGQARQSSRSARKTSSASG